MMEVYTHHLYSRLAYTIYDEHHPDVAHRLGAIAEFIRNSMRTPPRVMFSPSSSNAV
jgi:hypothetical protein